MASIYFVGPYEPIVCGIADYTAFLSRASRNWSGGVLSFNPTKYGTTLAEAYQPEHNRIWYGIPDRDNYGVEVIQRGLEELDAPGKEAVLWFQHEFGIWPHSNQFLNMLDGLDQPKAVTLHTLHFQSTETPTGLRKNQCDFLHMLLPRVDAITVFSRGVHRAVTAAFPQYAAKVYVVKHGVHWYPEVNRLSRREAKEELNDYLLYDSGLDFKTREDLHRQGILLDPETVVIGQTGFLSPSKGTELLYTVRDALQAAIPNKRIAAIRIGHPRDEIQKAYARILLDQQGGKPNFLVESWLPRGVLPLAQRAFDINFYWPEECTQSGVLAHALGAGAMVAGRDLEGVGETLRDAGAIVDKNLTHLTRKMRDVLLDPELGNRIAQRTLSYARELSWETQFRRHYEIAKSLVELTPVSLSSRSPSAVLDGTATLANTIARAAEVSAWNEQTART